MVKKFDAMGQKLHGDVMLTETDYRSTWEQGIAGAFSVPTPADQLPDWTDLSDLASTSFGGKVSCCVKRLPVDTPVDRSCSPLTSGSLDATLW